MTGALTGLVASEVHVDLYSVPVDTRGSTVAGIEVSFASVYKGLIDAIDAIEQEPYGFEPFAGQVSFAAEL